MLTNALVDHLVMDGKSCSGVKFKHAGHTFLAKASKETLLSAGAIGSVQILERSGIGNAEYLKSIGIRVAHDLPGVGENLQDHLQIRMVYKINRLKTLNTIASNWWGKLLIGLQYLLTRSGPMSMAPSQLGLFACSSSEHARPNIQYHVQPLS